jgi:hypothetical protein
MDILISIMSLKRFLPMCQPLKVATRLEDIAAPHTPAESGVVTTSLPVSGSGVFIHTDSNNIILTPGANYSIDSHQTIDVS